MVDLLTEEYSRFYEVSSLWVALFRKDAISTNRVKYNL